jgi:sugar phosphate isomerase/epimerase
VDRSRADIGAWTRPWAAFGLEAALQHIAATGFESVGLMTANRPQTPARSSPVIGADDDPARIAEVERRVAASGLRPAIMMSSVRLSDPDKAVATQRRNIGVAQRMGCPFVHTGGSSRPEEHDAFFATVAAVQDDLARSGLRLLMKPHGGLSATAAQCLAVVRRIGSPYFGILWDPGNVWHYTGTAPEEGFAALAPHVRAVCLKDFPPEGHEGPVLPGRGRVDWRLLFTVLRDVGFAGPCLLETLPGTAPEEIDAAAVESRRFFADLLERVFGRAG